MLYFDHKKPWEVLCRPLLVKVIRFLRFEFFITFDPEPFVVISGVHVWIDRLGAESPEVAWKMS